MQIVVRPFGLLYGADARAAMDRGAAFALAGGDSAFTQAEYIRRAGPRIIERRVVSVDELATLASFDPYTRARLDFILPQRPPGAGLTLDRPRIVGILNVTPDSFSDGGSYHAPADALDHARRMKVDGADILDIGGESTRPGAQEISLQEELDRVIPVIEKLHAEGLGPLSIDTRHGAVMTAAIAAGAGLINDVSALTHDPASLEIAAASNLPVILMHAGGTPEVMQDSPEYDDVVLDVFAMLEGRIQAAEANGIARSRIIVDPGIGFGKTRAHNIALIQNLAAFHGLGCPVMLGASRKSFMKDLPGGAVPENRVPGTISATLWGMAQGIQFHRVHDVAAVKQAMTLHENLIYSH